MSKKKLIDAEKFKERIDCISTNVYVGLSYSSSTPYIEDPISQAIYTQLETLEIQMNQKLENALTSLLVEISCAIDDSTYKDHPCLLCKDSEDMASPVEDFGDIRMPKKIANL